MTDDAARRQRWQFMTVGLMVVAYTGYYVCRSNLSVALTLIEAELAAGGLRAASVRMATGTMVSLGIFAYAVGKFCGGGLADALGGRRAVLLGMAGSVACTVLFTLGGGASAFTAAWVGNRFAQSLGWVGMVKITARWFPPESYGRVMGVLSLSYLFGDTLAREFLGRLLDAGLTWRGVFLTAAGVLAVLFVACAGLLKESPGRVGLAEPPSSPASVYGADGGRPTPPGLRALVVPLLTSPGFLLVCLLSVGVTLLRESFTAWTPTYLTEVAGLTPGLAARRSGLFPLFGGVSVLLAGYVGDRLGRVGRAGLICGGLALAGAALAALGLSGPGGSADRPVALLAAVSFLLIGPYSFLAGAIALDFGGKRGSATASALIDGFGYLGGMAAGAGVARLSTRSGWGTAFGALAGVAWLTAAVAVFFLLDQRRHDGPRTQAPRS